MPNKVFIATSLDGFIADAEGGIEWLNKIPAPEGNDMGYSKFMKGIDAILMGRNSFEKVLSFGIDWPYDKPVYVLSTTLKKVPGELNGMVFLLNGNIQDVLKEMHSRGHKNLYIDGGKTIQGLLELDLIDEMTITRIPVLLGKGIPLFGELSSQIWFRCVHTERFENDITQEQYRREL